VRRFSLAIMILGLFSAPASAEWRRAVSRHFIVYSEASPSELRQYAQKLERFDALLRLMSPVQAEDSGAPLTVFMPTFRDSVVDLVGSAVAAGVYYPRIGGSMAVAPRRINNDSVDHVGFNSDTVLFHEYAHHYMLENYTAAYPPWFVEGYAELLSTTRFNSDGSIQIGNPEGHRDGERMLHPLPLRTLLFEDFWSQRGENAETYYAQAWLLTHYLTLSDERPGQLRRYLGLLAAGRPAEQAAEEAFGGVQTLERDFSRYRRAPSIPYIGISFDHAPAIPEVRIETLPAGEESIAWQRAIYMHGLSPDQAPGFANAVRGRAAAFPADPAVLQLLADAEFLASNDAAATRAVDALLALQPNAPRALLRKGLIELSAVEKRSDTDEVHWAAARAWVVRANRADPQDPLPLFEYYRSFQRQGVRPPPDAGLALLRAFELAPQDADLRTTLADWLVGARRYHEAVIVLSPVAYSPHPTPRRAQAAALIDRIRPLPDGADPPPAAPAPAPSPGH
jgi:hypothetical protein